MAVPLKDGKLVRDEDGTVHPSKESWLQIDAVIRPFEDNDEEVFDTLGSADSAGHVTALSMDLERAVASLPPRARAVLVLYDVEGWKHEEIAIELGMAVGSSKAQLHRARSLLRSRLGEQA